MIGNFNIGITCRALLLLLGLFLISCITELYIAKIYPKLKDSFLSKTWKQIRSKIAGKKDPDYPLIRVEIPATNHNAQISAMSIKLTSNQLVTSLIKSPGKKGNQTWIYIEREGKTDYRMTIIELIKNGKECNHE